MKTIGLTGGLGTGKTTALLFFKKLGAAVLSSDDLVHEELRTNELLKAKIRRKFGCDVFLKRQISRRRLAQKAFGNPAALKQLNAWVHPLVKKNILRWMKRALRQEKASIVVVEVPLLFEAGFDRFFDLTIGVATDPAIQKARLRKNTKFSPADISRRMRWQLPLDQKIARCDFIIDNNASKQETFQQIKKLMELLRKQSRREKSGKA